MSNVNRFVWLSFFFGVDRLHANNINIIVIVSSSNVYLYSILLYIFFMFFFLSYQTNHYV